MKTLSIRSNEKTKGNNDNYALYINGNMVMTYATYENVAKAMAELIQLYAADGTPVQAKFL